MKVAILPNGKRIIRYPIAKLRQKYKYSSLLNGCHFCYFYDPDSKQGKCSAYGEYKEVCRLIDTRARSISLDRAGYNKYIRHYNNPYEGNSI